MTKRFGYLFYVLIAVVIGLELSLRCLGYQPGTFTKDSGLEEVDSLTVYENFINDSFGVYRFSSWVSDSIPKSYVRHSGKFSEVERELFQLNWIDAIDYIWETAYCLTAREKPGGCGLDQGEDWDTPFVNLVDSLRNATAQPTPFDSLVLEYSEKPFNSEGFRSITFSPVRSNRLKVLILGDSFAYGMTARPYFNSFPDHLLAMGYLVYNTGIPGVDPAQYAAVVDEYLDELNPDVVIVNLFIGNDLMPFPRVPHPDRPHEHMTNAAFFTSSPLGTYLTPKEAYEYYLSFQKLPVDNENQVSRICSKSSLLSVIWGICYKLIGYGHPAVDKYNETQSAISMTTRLSNTIPHLKEIQARCDSSKTKVLYCVIPDFFDEPGNKDGHFRTDPELLKKLFHKTPYHEPKNMMASDFYGDDDYHFNNEGHEKYALFLDSLIKTIVEP